MGLIKHITLQQNARTKQIFLYLSDLSCLMKNQLFIIVVVMILLTGCGKPTEPEQSGLTITTTELPEWETGKPGLLTLNAVGGNPPYTWAITAENLPAGLNLAPNGVISGIHILAPGTSKSISPPFTVSVTDAAGAAKTIQLTITVTEAHPKIEILTAVCTAGLPCNAQIANAGGGTPPYTFQQDTFRQGTLPFGVVIGVNGLLTGTANKPGVYQFGVCVKDTVALSDCAPATLEIEEPNEPKLEVEGPEVNQPTPSTVSVKPGPPRCPSGSGDFFLGKARLSSSGGKYINVIDPGEMFIPPKYVNAWGEEATIFCSYLRDSGEKEWDGLEYGLIIYEDASVQVDYQTSDTFEARPDWARESYCSGKTNVRQDGIYQDMFRSSHVIKATFATKTGLGKDASSEMKAVADDIISQIEQAPYAIRCP